MPDKKIKDLGTTNTALANTDRIPCERPGSYNTVYKTGLAVSNTIVKDTKTYYNKFVGTYTTTINANAGISTHTLYSNLTGAILQQKPIVVVIRVRAQSTTAIVTDRTKAAYIILNISKGTNNVLTLIGLPKTHYNVGNASATNTIVNDNDIFTNGTDLSIRLGNTSPLIGGYNASFVVNYEIYYHPF